MSSSSVDPRFVPLIQSALDAGGGHYRPGDIIDMIDQGQLDFWPGRESCMVTKLVDYPGGRTLRFALGAGNLDEIVLMEAFLSARAATHQGAVKAEIIGRSGWRRALPDYRKIQEVMLKDL